MALAQQQSQFAAQVLDAPTRKGPFRRGDGFAVYRSNLLAVAEAALAVTYPTVRRLLGEEYFKPLVADLLNLYPPVRGDWGEWGKELPLLVGASAAGIKHPFLAPAAELDWLRHRANRAPDNQFDASTVHLLESHRVDGIGIGIAAHVGITGSTYPLVDIIDWHANPVSRRRELQVAESVRPVMVYRSEFRVEQRYISKADCRFVQGLRNGRSVGSLLDEEVGEDFDFPVWIQRAITKNLISNLYLI